MGITLLIGREDDFCCRLVRDRLTETGDDYVFLREDELFPGLTFAWELWQGRSSGYLGIGSDTVPIEQIDSVFARFSGITTSAEEHQTKDGQYLNSEWHALARGFTHGLPCRVVNRLMPELWYKMSLKTPDIVALIPGCGFRLPRTLITTRFEAARSFFESCGRRMSYSPVAMPSCYTIDSESQLQKLEPLVKVLPLCLSEAIEGQTISAFVVGREVLFDGLASEAASRLCLEAARRLGLSFCEFELLRTPSGDWLCLGIQCAPNLFDCSDPAREAVADGLSALLCSRKKRMAA